MIALRSKLAGQAWLVFGIVLGLAATVGARAEKGDLWLDVNGTSWHTENDYYWEGQVRKYNAANLGLGLGVGLNDWSELKAGWFDNSYYKTSVYLMVDVKPTFLTWRPGNWYVAPGVVFGAITGYEHTPEQTGAVAPLALIDLTVGHVKGWRITLGYLPSTLVRENGVDVITLLFSYRLRP